jgi:hypothetical protein
MTPHESTAWRLAGDLLLDDPREGDDWGLAREALALRILANLRDDRPVASSPVTLQRSGLAAVEHTRREHMDNDPTIYETHPWFACLRDASVFVAVITAWLVALGAWGIL